MAPKSLEVRLFDEKRSNIKIGDKITFVHNNEKVTVVVTNLSKFPSFCELFSSLGGKSAGWEGQDTPEKLISDMRKYYLEEKEKKFGVLGIHIQLAKS